MAPTRSQPTRRSMDSAYRRTSVRFEPIADRLDGRNTRAEVSELGAKPADVHVNRAGLDRIGARVPPHAIEQMLAGEHAAGGPHQRVQQFELERKGLV